MHIVASIILTAFLFISSVFAEPAEPALSAPSTGEALATDASGTTSSAEAEELHRVGLFASPLGIVIGQVPLELDVRFARTATLNLQGQYVRSGDFSGFGVAGGPQWFFTGEAFHGGYVFPTVAYASLSGSGTDARALGFGATVGYQWHWGHFGLRLGGGAMYYTAWADNSQVDVAIDGISPAVDFSLGATF